MERATELVVACLLFGLAALPGCWNQQVGLDGGAPEDQHVPEAFVQVTVGVWHSCGLGTEHEVVCWGGDAEVYAGQCDVVDGDYAQVSAGESSTCALTTDGHVVCWGCDEMDHGQCDPPATS